MDGMGGSGVGDDFDAPQAPSEADRASHESPAPMRVPLDGMPRLGGDAVLPEEVCVPSPAGSGHAPPDSELAKLLARTRTVAVVGMSPTSSRTSHGVAEWLADKAHFDLYFVNPMAVGETALGQPFYAELADLPVTPDMVDVFRRPELVPPVADDAIAVGASSLWLQLGIVNEGAAAAARDAGLDVIQNRCLKIEYRRLSSRIQALLAA